MLVMTDQPGARVKIFPLLIPLYPTPRKKRLLQAEIEIDSD